MENNFLNGNHLIKEKISAFRAEPTAEGYGAIFEEMQERIAEDGHFLIPCQIADKDQENPVFYFHQIQTEDGSIYLAAFTDEEEAEKGEKTELLSDFIDQFFDIVFSDPFVAGFILNPWGETTFTVSKALMQRMVDEKDMETDALEANALLEKAIHFAAEKHAGAVRKGTTRPYIEHPLEVMTILGHMNADKNLQMAGLLHDTLEDTDTHYGELKEEFGTDVAALVAVHTKNPDQTWEEVRIHKLEAMEEASFRENMLIMADAAANLRSLWKDYRQVGEELWERFNASKEKQAWYYSEMQDRLFMMQEYMETAEIYWEMVGLYKDLFVDYYLDAEENMLYQSSADGITFVLIQGDPQWKETEFPKNAENLQPMGRMAAERLENFWNGMIGLQGR